MIKAVLDTNVIVSGVIKEDGVPGQLLKAFLRDDRFLLVTSPEILIEVALALKYPKIRNIHGWSDEKIEASLIGLYSVSLRESSPAFSCHQCNDFLPCHLSDHYPKAPE